LDDGFFGWWLERPWWLRWSISLLPLGVALVLLFSLDRFYFWLWGVGAAMCLINLFVSWGEILDAVMGRKK